MKDVRVWGEGQGSVWSKIGESIADLLVVRFVGGDSAKASQQDFINKGPAIVEDLPSKTGKDELRARAEELNK